MRQTTGGRAQTGSLASPFALRRSICQRPKFPHQHLLEVHHQQNSHLLAIPALISVTAIVLSPNTFENVSLAYVLARNELCTTSSILLRLAACTLPTSLPHAYRHQWPWRMR